MQAVRAWPAQFLWILSYLGASKEGESARILFVWPRGEEMDSWGKDRKESLEWSQLGK